MDEKVDGAGEVFRRETAKASLEVPSREALALAAVTQQVRGGAISPFSAQLPGLLQEALLQGLARSGELRGQIESLC